MSFPESVIFVSMNSCNLVSANRFTERIFNLPDQDLGTETPIIIQKDDVLLMLDSSWAIYDQFIPYFRCVKKFGGNVVTIIYDLIPIYYPALCAESITDIFENWLRLAIIHSNKFICISQTIAQQFVDYLHTNHIKIDHRLFIHYFHLGANLLRENQKIVNTLIESRKVSDESMFLMVGTIEPRKGHEFVLDVFDELWNQSYSGKLCIAGKFGWNVKNIKDRILDHPFFGKKVLLFENPTDETIQNLYSKSSAVIVASIAEGFGLPIVEAAFHRCPAIMSDIPVFREIGGENGLYFCKNSKSGLKNAIQKIDTLSLHEKNELAECVNLITWSKSAEWFIEEIYSLNPFATFPNN